MEGKILISTVPDPITAEKLSRTLVEERLAACVSVMGGVRSTYWWKGKIETAQEVQLILKTRASLVPALSARLKQLHPYEVPEIVEIKPDSIDPRYLSWLLESTEVPQALAVN